MGFGGGGGVEAGRLRAVGTLLFPFPFPSFPFPFPPAFLLDRFAGAPVKLYGTDPYPFDVRM